LTPMRPGGDEDAMKNFRRFQKQNSDNLGCIQELGDD